MILSMICAVAQEESLSISKNLKWGIRKRMQNGTYTNSSVPFGYSLENHLLVINNQQAMIVADIFKRYLAGESISKIAQYLNNTYPKETGVWQYSSVQLILQNETYKGDTRYQKHYTANLFPTKVSHNRGQVSQYYIAKSHEAIISDEDFDKVQSLLKMKAPHIPYHEGTQKWNQNMVGRILASKIYYDNVKYPPIISETQYNLAEKRRCEKHQAYSTILQPFRQDMQCGCCDERLYWHPKTNQWFCRRCGMWAKPLRAEETSAAIAEKLCWLRQNPEIIHTPEGQANVQSVEVALLDREIWQALTNAEPDVDALVAKILHRAEMEYKFCTAGDADPVTLQIQKACAEYKPTEEFPETFYKEVISKVILYRDTHIEFKLQNGQIV